MKRSTQQSDKTIHAPLREHGISSVRITSYSSKWKFIGLRPQTYRLLTTAGNAAAVLQRYAE